MRGRLSREIVTLPPESQQIVLTWLVNPRGSPVKRHVTWANRPCRVHCWGEQSTNMLVKYNPIVNYLFTYCLLSLKWQSMYCTLLSKWKMLVYNVVTKYISFAEKRISHDCEEDRKQMSQLQCIGQKANFTIAYYSSIMISTVASQMTGVSSLCSIVCSGADQRKHRSSAALAFVRGIHG